MDFSKNQQSSQIIDSTMDQLLEGLAKSSPTSGAFYGIASEIQRRHLKELNTAIGRAESVGIALSGQMDRLTEVAERTDKQTRTLRHFTIGLYMLTAVLVVATFVLAYIAHHTDVRVGQIHQIAERYYGQHQTNAAAPQKP